MIYFLSGGEHEEMIDYPRFIVVVVSLVAILSHGVTTASAATSTPITDYEAQLGSINEKVATLRSDAGVLTESLDSLSTKTLAQAQTYVDSSIGAVEELIVATKQGATINASITKALNWAEQHKSRISKDGTLPPKDIKELVKRWQEQIDRMKKSQDQIASAYKTLVSSLASLTTRRRLLAEYTLISNMELITGELERFAADLLALTEELGTLAADPALRSASDTST